MRYYGRGHEACAAEVVRAARSIIQGQGPSADDGVGDAAAAPGADQSADPEEAEADAFGGPPTGHADAAVSAEDLDTALQILRAKQEETPAELGETAAKQRGILRQRGGAAGSPAVAAREFQPVAARLQWAVQRVAAVLGAPDQSPETVLDCLSVGIGVSELVVSRALRVLASQAVGLRPPQEDLAADVAGWAFAALRKHADGVDVCTAVVELLVAAMHLFPPSWLATGEAGAIAAALKEYPHCRALQQHGFILI